MVALVGGLPKKRIFLLQGVTQVTTEKLNQNEFAYIASLFKFFAHTKSEF